MSNIRKIVSSFIRFLEKHFVLFFYKITLDLMYYYEISDRYAYIVGDKDPIGWKCALGWMFFFLLTYIGIKINNKDLYFSFNFLMVLSAIPSITVLWVRNGDMSAFLLTMCFWIMMAFSCNMISRTVYGYNSLYDDPGFMPKANNFIVMLCFIFLVVTTIYYSYRFGNFRLFVRFSDVYDYRMDTSNYMGTIDSYVYSWNTNLLLPMLLIVHLCNRKYLLVFADVILGLMLYAIYGNKFIVFQLIYVVGIWMVNKLDLRRSLNNVITFTITIAGVVSIIFKETNGGRLGIALLYRLLFIPTEAHFFYYDFFQSNPYLYLRQSILRLFFENPYDNPISIIIGSSIKYNHTGNYNNLSNGLFSDAYANFGFWGVMVYPILIVILVLIYSKRMRRFDETFRKAILITFLGQIISASPFQSVLTGGMLIGLLLIYAIQKTSKFEI